MKLKFTIKQNKICTYNKGITLIALIITIIVLLILVGVTIKLTIGEKGIFKTAQRAGKNYVNSSKVENQILQNYEEEIAQNISNNQKKLSDILKDANLSQDYTEDDIKNNKDGILDKLLSTKDGLDYIIDNIDKYLDTIIKDEELMKELGKSDYAQDKIMSDKELFDKITSSDYIKSFEENAKKVPPLTSNNDKGYKIDGIGVDVLGMGLYKAFDGIRETTWLDTYYAGDVYGDGSITIEFPQASKIYHIYYYIENNWAGNYTSQKYKVYGITTNEEKLIAEGTLGMQEKDIYFYNNNAYKKYKLVFEHGGQGTGASEINIYYR